MIEVISCRIFQAAAAILMVIAFRDHSLWEAGAYLFVVLQQQFQFDRLMKEMTIDVD